MTFPIDLSRDGSVKDRPGAWSAALSWGNVYRALEGGFAMLAPGHWLGDAWGPAQSIDEVEAVIIAWDHPGPEGPFLAVSIPRDAELNDAHVDYRGLDRAAVNERLRGLGVLIRESIFPPA